MFALGGAVIVHDVPAQATAGNIVRCPILFPWVLVSAPISETLTLDIGPWDSVTPMVMEAPYVQSLFVIVKLGCVKPERR